jgi:hypothetical protein
MELIIYFEPDSPQTVLRLMDDEHLIDELIIGVDIHFDTVLVTSIDKLLKKNRIEQSSLKLVSVAPKTDNGSVAYRTAQAVAEAINVRKIAANFYP